MMKGIVMTTLFILTIFLTVLLAHNWQGLDSEQQAFVELAAYIEERRMYWMRAQIVKTLKPWIIREK